MSKPDEFLPKETHVGECNLQQHFGRLGHVNLHYWRDGFDSLFERFEPMDQAGKTLAAYIYSTNNPGALPESIKAAMQVFEG